MNVPTVLCLASVLRAEFGSRESSASDKQLLTIYDLDNKFIAYSASFDDVIDVVAEWGSFYILTRDNKMFVLQEKDTQTKLEVRRLHLEPMITGVKNWISQLAAVSHVSLLVFFVRCCLRKTCL